MKFLQEMIAKKRAQQHEQEASIERLEDSWAEADASEEAVELDEPLSEAAEALEIAEQDPIVSEVQDQPWDGDLDDESLFDDGSYGWNLDDAETQEIPDEPVTIPELERHEEEDEDQDFSIGASIVLNDLIARNQSAEPTREMAPEQRPAPEVAETDSIEASVEKLRIQRKIWDLDETPAASAAMPMNTGSETKHEDNTPSMRAVEDEPERTSIEHPARIERPRPAAMSEEVAEPAAPQPRRAGRVKTRLLGFHKGDDEAIRNPFDDPQPTPAALPGDPQFPVGWIIVTDGPGRGASFTLTAGASKIGRGEDQAVRLDFGDTSISRDNHAAIAFDGEQRCFYIGHGGKANLVRLNDMPVLSTEPLADGDIIRIGETTLRFVAFCGPEFSWDDEADGDAQYAAAE